MVIFKKIWYMIPFVMMYLIRLIKSNITVAYDILSPKFRMTPGIIRMPVDVKTDNQILALVNLVTMTPGTLSLDLSDDRKTLYIHAMYAKNLESLYKEIKSLEKMIQKAF